MRHEIQTVSKTWPVLASRKDKKRKRVEREAAGGSVIQLEVLCEQQLEQFAEVVIAPGYDDDALAIFAKKKNLRVVSWRDWERSAARALKEVTGGVLAQAPDTSLDDRDLRACRVVTRRVLLRPHLIYMPILLVWYAAPLSFHSLQPTG